jgi:two-component system cell cycle sensor histidine kinase/response regulator CckA
MTDERSVPELLEELEDLRARLAEAEDVVRAIRFGQVDAVVVAGDHGKQIYTLLGADRIYRQFIETMSEGAGILSAAGAILYGNNRLAEMLGRPLNQVLGTVLRDYLPPADRQALEAIPQEAGGAPIHREFSLMASDGRQVPVYMSASHLPNEGEGTLLVLTDLTEQRRHVQIAAAERLARLILEQAAEVIIVCDQQGRVTRVNQAAQSLCDGSPLLRPFAEVFSLRTSGPRPFQLAPVLQGETIRDVDVVMERHGEKLVLILNAGPLTSGKEILGCVVTLTDITERGRAEAALRASEQEFRSLAEAMPQIAWITRPDGWNIYFNQQWVDYTGLTLEESYGNGWSKPFHPDDQQRAWDAWQDATQNDATYSVECRLRRADGVYRWWLIRGVPLRDARARILKWFGTCTDIDAIKQHEATVRQSEDEFRAMFELASIGMAQADPRTGQWLRVNQKMCAITGYSADEMLRMHISDITHPEDRQEDAEAFQRVVRGEAANYHLEERYLRKDGAVAWANVNMTVIRDAAGLPTRTMATIEDITQRKLEEAVREQLATAIEQAGETVLVADAQGNITYVNPAFEAVTGYARTEVLGRNPRILKSGVQSKEFYRGLWNTIGSGKTWHGRLVNKRKNCTLFTEDATISPVRDTAGMITSYVSVKRDITHFLAQEAELLQAQKMEGIGRLAGGVAHDFNNILSVILSSAELALEGLREGDPLREDLLDIQKSGNRAAVLTRQLLAFSRKQVLQPVPLDLNQALAEMEKMLRRILGEDIEFVRVLSPDIWLVKADPGQVEQVIMNLVVNARDAMPKGGKLTIETANVELDQVFTDSNAGTAPGPHVRVMVSDSGLGMDEPTMARVFEPFFTTKGVGKGTGLGLSTVYGIVKQSGGSISVHSAPGQGTTFKVYLPRDISLAGPVVTATTAVTRPVGTETVLVVEDEQAVRNIARRILERAGYTVLTAASGGDALLTCEQHPTEIDLVLTDVVMPQMSGKDFVDRLASIRPGIRVLFMSGYTGDVILKHGLLEAGTQFIGKPFTQAELLQKVRYVLDDAGRQG